MTVTQLRTLLAVIRGGSVTAAADELVVTQPSVSSALAALARELGCDMFERSGRGIRLTPSGAAFAPYAADVLGLLDQGRQAAQEAADGTARKLEIIAVTTAAESFVPPLMRLFADEHPEIELTLAVGNREDVLERVLNHSADVAISGKPPADDRLVAERLIDNEIVCITAPDDPAVGRPRSAAGELAGRRWLLREPGSGTRTLNEQFLADRGWIPRPSRSDPTGRSSRPREPAWASRCSPVRPWKPSLHRDGSASSGSKTGPRRDRGSCCARPWGRSGCRSRAARSRAALRWSSVVSAPVDLRGYPKTSSPQTRSGSCAPAKA